MYSIRQLASVGPHSPVNSGLFKGFQGFLAHHRGDNLGTSTNTFIQVSCICMRSNTSSRRNVTTSSNSNSEQTRAQLAVKDDPNHFSQRDSTSRYKNSRSQQNQMQLVPVTGNDNDFSLGVKRRSSIEIIRVPEQELKGYAIGVMKRGLADRRGEWMSLSRDFTKDSEKTRLPMLQLIQMDLDLRPSAIKRWVKSIKTEISLIEQEYNPKRCTVLGNDLAAAHFVVFRKGRIRFKGQTEWITEYRIDEKQAREEGKDDLDLPVLTAKLCTMPTKFDPRYRVEAIDMSGMSITYDGLKCISSIDYIRWLSFRNCPLFDDWCIDRVLCEFEDHLEYIDISGTRVTERGLCALSRAKNLRTLVAENLEIKNLEIVCAQLEDLTPGLICIGPNYERKLKELREENILLEQKAKEKELEEKNQLELINKNTLDVNSASLSVLDIDSIKTREEALAQTKIFFDERLDRF